MMRLDLKALAWTAAAFWGLTVLVVGAINYFRPGYGQAFLEVLTSLYPGYHATATIGDLLTATGYALMDGAVGGWVFGWLYNRVVARSS